MVNKNNRTVPINTEINGENDKANHRGVCKYKIMSIISLEFIFLSGYEINCGLLVVTLIDGSEKVKLYYNSYYKINYMSLTMILIDDSKQVSKLRFVFKL